MTDDGIVGDGQWTIYDIAREAGVSAKTVSRVLNEKSGVGDATRSRILDIMRRVDYHPHIGARTLRAKGNACVGVAVSAPPNIVPISQNFFLWLFTELFRIFGMRGEYMCFDMNPFAGPLGHDYARGILEQLYKACVIAGPLAVHDTSIQRIAKSGLPYMALGRLDSIRDISCATVDYEQGAYMSTRFLLSRGHRRIAILKAFSGFQPGVERRRGYTRALEEAGIPVQEELIRATNFGGPDIARFTHRLLRDNKVTALIDCSATEDGDNLREGARRAGRVIGQDLDVVVWTYAETGAVLPEAAAHVWLPVREAAAEGLEQLSAWLAEEREGPIRLVYQPVLNQEVNGKEVPKPRRLFLTNENE